MHISFDLSDAFNENKSFTDKLLKYIIKDDIILFDRGYYSNNLIKQIDNKNAYFICRMKQSALCVKLIEEHILADGFYWIKNYGVLRTVKYVINNENFYLSTNIFDKDINFFIELYHKRWYIEEFYKTIKCNMKLDTINYKKIIKIKQNIYAHFILSILGRYMEA